MNAATMSVRSAFLLGLPQSLRIGGPSCPSMRWPRHGNPLVERISSFTPARRATCSPNTAKGCFGRLFPFSTARVSWKELIYPKKRTISTISAVHQADYRCWPNPTGLLRSTRGRWTRAGESLEWSTIASTDDSPLTSKRQLVGSCALCVAIHCWWKSQLPKFRHRSLPWGSR